MTEATSLTETALSRLRALTKGNGLSPNEIDLIETKEQTYTISGTLTLTPELSVKGRTTLGRVKSKGSRILSSFEELASEVRAIEKSFKDEADWLDPAIEELDRTDGKGWGHSQALLMWSDQKTILRATENCPTCRGTAQRTCPECKGLGHIFCHYCEGRGQEICTLCVGSGKDPLNPQNKCSTCQGTRYSLCRFCQGTGKMHCTVCQNKGHLACADCKGSGFLSREVLVKKGARMDFVLGATSGLPSGFLRNLSRIGDDRLCKGHADFTLIPPSLEDRKAQSHYTIKIEAKIPYADMKVRFGKKAVLVSCFGKQARLSGVPAFLDEALVSARSTLAGAARGTLPLEAAIKTRLMRDTLALALAGKIHPNELRKQYPVGLSGEVATEIMTNTRQLLKSTTSQTRMAVGLAAAAFSALFFTGLFYTGFFGTFTANLPSPVTLLLKALILTGALGLAWLFLVQSSRWRLQRKFPQTKIVLNQPVGKTGYIIFSLILAIYLVILFISGHLL